MQFPENVLAIANEEAAEHGDDIAKAVEDAVKRVKKLDEYAELVGDLVHHAVQNLVHQARHRRNWSLKSQSGEDHAKSKVNGMSNGVLDIYESYYGYCIGARTLGSILGSELDGLVAQEKAVARGHTFNAELCEKLRAMVPDDKRVSEAVPEKKLRKLFQDVRRTVEWAPEPSVNGHARGRVPVTAG